MSDEQSEQESKSRLVTIAKKLLGSAGKDSGTDQEKDLDETANLLGSLAAKISTDDIRRRYWLIPRGTKPNLIAICGVIIALCTLASAVLSWWTNTKIDLKAEGQAIIVKTIGDLETSGAGPC